MPPIGRTLSGTIVLTLQQASGSPERLVEQISGYHPRGSESVDLEWGQESAFLTSSQMLLLQLIWMPHSEKPRCRQWGTTDESYFLWKGLLAAWMAGKEPWQG